MVNQIKRAKQMVIDGLVERTSESIWKVGDEIVRMISKPGRNVFTCTCKNSVDFCNENTNCVHKFAVVLFEADENFYVKINKMIREYEESKELGISMAIETIIEDLKTLRYLK